MKKTMKITVILALTLVFCFAPVLLVMAGKPDKGGGCVIKVSDATGQPLGILLTHEANVVEIFTPNGKFFNAMQYILYEPTGRYLVPHIYYQNSGCTGQAFIYDTPTRIHQDHICYRSDTDQIFVLMPAGFHELTSIRYLDTGVCVDDSKTRFVYPLHEIAPEDLPFTLPITLPLTYEYGSP